MGNDLPSLREHGFWSRANSENDTSASSLRPQGLEFFLPFRHLEIDIFLLPALEHNDIKRHGLFSPSCLRLASVGVIHFASSRHMPSFCFSSLFSFCKHANVAVLTLMARNEKQLLCLLLSSYFFCVSSAQCWGEVSVWDSHAQLWILRVEVELGVCTCCWLSRHKSSCQTCEEKMRGLQSANMQEAIRKRKIVCAYACVFERECVCFWVCVFECVCVRVCVGKRDRGLVFTTTATTKMASPADPATAREERSCTNKEYSPTPSSLPIIKKAPTKTHA